MSGGVDSSVAAALLAEQGHDVIGLSMQLYDQRGGEQAWGTCCTLDDLQDARRVASTLGFPHYILNFERQFQETVISNFVREYASGRTPLPCAHCNSDLKFSTLLDRARGLGAEQIALVLAQPQPQFVHRYRAAQKACSWTVWPHSRSRGWLQRITRPIRP